LEFTFCMCNPPFYGEDEAETVLMSVFVMFRSFVCSHKNQEIKFKKFVQLDESNKAMENKCYEVTKRSAPHSATIGRRNELSVTGGEVGFVGRLIEDSFVLQNSVKFYTSMIGKKASLNELTRKLKEYGNVHYAVSTLSQGRTQRWVLTWSFDANLKLSMNSTECSPLTVPLPASVPLCCPDECYSTMKRLLNFLEIKFEENEKSELICEAKHDTWSNQRQKRRLNDRLMSSLTSHKSNEEPLRKKKRFSERIQSDNCGVNASQDIGVMVNLGVGNGCDSLSNDGNFNFIASECHSSCQTDVAIQVYLPSSSLPLSSSSSVTSMRSVCDQSLVRFRLTANIFEKRVELRWIDGSRHRLYQISQYIKNQVSHFIDDQ
uniref:Methyltransferase-like protein 16 homolog (inferred by orthology to a C. elegans protein) n=1 Tax=Anisakis simplex TaxID=6269 RepID=A0A0M3KDW4_ANISI